MSITGAIIICIQTALIEQLDTASNMTMIYYIAECYRNESIRRYYETGIGKNVFSAGLSDSG